MLNQKGIIIAVAFYIIQSGMPSIAQFIHPDIYSFTVAERDELNTLIIDYITNNNPAVGHNAQIIADPGLAFEDRVHGGKLFLPWHRTVMVGGLENFILSQGAQFAKYVPLPKWDPNDCIPDEFFGADAFVVLPNCGVDPVGCDQPQNQCPGTFDFSQFDITQNMNLCDGAFDDFTNDFDAAHGPVHINIGGAMAGGYSPAASIFFLWHAFVDDIYESYLCKCSNDDDGLDNFYEQPNIDVQFGIASFFLQIINGIPEIHIWRNFSTIGTIVIPDIADLDVIAGNRIVLEPGFSTELGAQFIAEIDNCPRPGDQTPCKTGNPNSTIVDTTTNVNSDTITNTGSQATTPNQPLSDVDTNTNNLSSIRIYPNPNTGQFTLKYISNEEEPAVITITDLMGKAANGRILHQDHCLLKVWI